MKNVIGRYMLILFTCYSCTSVHENSVLTLKVNLEDKGTSFYDLFEKLEIIPLELNENSFIKQIESLQLINDTLFVFDRELFSLILFDGVSGKHLNTIMKIGEGPDEYSYVYDVIIDTAKNEVNFLSPYGNIYTYDFSGGFINKKNLPSPPESYLHFTNFDDSTYLVWGNSFQDREVGNIVLLSKHNYEVVNSFWKGEGIEDRFVTSPFWSYDEQTFFSTSVTNMVYQVTPTGCKLAYKWDFSKYDIDRFREEEIIKSIDIKNSSQRIQQIMQEMILSDKLYRFNSRYENSMYYYAQIVFKNDKKLSPHIFYNKERKEGCSFYKTVEGLSFITLAFTDDYVLAELLPECIDEVLLTDFLTEENKMKLKMIQQDDNPIILKLFLSKLKH